MQVISNLITSICKHPHQGQSHFHQKEQYQMMLNLAFSNKVIVPPVGKFVSSLVVTLNTKKVSEFLICKPWQH